MLEIETVGQWNNREEHLIIFWNHIVMFLSKVEKSRPYSSKFECLSKVKPNEATHLIGTY